MLSTASLCSVLYVRGNMYFSLTVVALLGPLALAREMPVDEVRAAELFDSGLKHETILANKQVYNTVTA